jgi:DNA excision repair protein ERCC-3
LQQFRFNPALNTIFISKIGDTSIDLPEANCLIQISSHFGSRRQEAQRLGRILRPKKGASSATCISAYFYSLVSTDTQDMYFSSKRQQFLINQGYEFKIISNIESMLDENSVYMKRADELSLLNTVLLCSVKEIEEQEPLNLDAAEDSNSEGIQSNHNDTSSDEEEISFVRKTSATMKVISGGDSLEYMEFNRGTSSGMERPTYRNRNKN